MTMAVDVREMPWDMLHPRTLQPASVLKSVTADDIHGFLRTLATNPLQDSADSTILKEVVSGHRTRYSEGMLAGEQFVGGKRKRMLGEDDSDAENARRPRRSNRPKTLQDNSSDEMSWEVAGKSRGHVTKVGTMYQVVVPKFKEMTDDERMKSCKVSSEMVFTPDAFPDKKYVEEYMTQLNDKLKRRDGYGCGPNAEETALVKLVEHNGDVKKATEEVCKKIQVGREFEGVGEPWTYVEKCKLVRALAEHGLNFHEISRNYIHRKTSEIVFMYYTYNKQQHLVHGNQVSGLIFDTGDELTEFLPKLGPERATMALRCLAKTAGDGFPADRRMAKAIRAVRGKVNYGNKRRGPTERK